MAQVIVTRDALQTVPPEPRKTTTLQPDLTLFPLDPADLVVKGLMDTPKTARANKLIRTIVNAVPRPGVDVSIEGIESALWDKIIDFVDYELNYSADRLSEFKRVKGQVLLYLAAQPTATGELAILPLLLGFRMTFWLDPKMQQRFVEESGLNRFCAAFPEKIVEGFLKYDKDIQKGIIMQDILSGLLKFCRQLVESSAALRSTETFADRDLFLTMRK
jgi:hypothetical protein